MLTLREMKLKYNVPLSSKCNVRLEITGKEITSETFNVLQKFIQMFQAAKRRQKMAHRSGPDADIV